MSGILLIVGSSIAMAVLIAVVTTSPRVPVAWRSKIATAIFVAWGLFIFAVSQHWIVG
jgi:hypothetical protein